jgi:sodium/potassium-transporting ATPase subunit alpha
MVTGDYLLTAAAIAKEIGIFSNLDIVDTLDCMRDKNKLINLNMKPNKKKMQNFSLLLNGSDVDFLTDSDWRCITKYKEIVFARTTPEQKLLIVKEFQKDDYIVGVTGDGVNDAPALKKADIGIAMGSGSEVAMEASQMVLLDNSFGSILTAIENGRLVFYNLRKVILYLLTAGCMGEVVPVLTNAFLGIPLPLSTFQMICICVLTDICPSLSLMLEKPEKNLLKQPPRSRNTRLVDWKLCFQAYFFIGFLQTFFSHCLFFWYLQWYGNFKPSDILFVYDKWEDGYHGYTKNQLNEFEYTGKL